MNPDFDAAIFDMDGTLLDTMPYWRFTALEYLMAHQLPIRRYVIDRLYGESTRKLLMEYARTEGIPMVREEMIRELEGYMDRHYRFDAHLKCPSVPAFLERLKAAGVRMCVATGAPREFACHGLKRLGLLNYFEFVTDHYEYGISKEQPEYFRLLLKRLGAKAERTWVFEDALYAMVSAHDAGLRVCAIEDETQAADRDRIKALADMYIRSYDELMSEGTTGPFPSL